MSQSGPPTTFLPDWHGGNPYQIFLAKALERKGVSVTLIDFPIGLFLCIAFRLFTTNRFSLKRDFKNIYSH